MKNLGRLYEVRAKFPGNKHETLLSRYRDAGTAAFDADHSNISGKRLWGEDRYSCYVFYPPAICK